jgi:hypothetical protein
MLTLLADGDVLFVIRLGFWTGNVAHGVFFPQLVINRSIEVTCINYIYSTYRYLSTNYYYMLCLKVFKVKRFRVQG